ncbi:hypothetical protein Tco_1042390 [Tanacetum coccineum]|uniref:Reverse transcriptase domain-containing protein n=1 Tax=Tanacetum coccineum TaxID=301880 RepID=A0ABQ5GIY5_9ASTR
MDTSIGSSALDITMREFKDCVETMEVMDVQRTGLHFTWNQKPKGKDGILHKLNHDLANLEFHDCFLGAHALFNPYRISDHSPSVLSIPSIGKVKSKPFKFFNVFILDKRFKDVVRDGWLAQVSGFHMFRVVKKLKGLKKPIRKLMYDKGNLHANVVRLREDLDKVQTTLDSDPSNVSIREKEAVAVVAFNDALLMEEKFLKQKAKITWLKEGDSNTAYFHKMVKSRVSRSRIDVVTDANGVVFQNEDVRKDILTTMRYEALNMDADISDLRIKIAMFFLWVVTKSPGSDGFTAAFFKDTWEIIGSDVTKAICEFFTNGRFLKELNHTIIALIPKVNARARVNDYRPISCCNVLFKCISNIIANRLKDSLKRLVSPNQSAFVLGRCISDNILLTQEIMHNYHLDHGAPRCAFKVDIQKAYDTVDWEFLRVAFIGFGFHDLMICLIMEWAVYYLTTGLFPSASMGPSMVTLGKRVFAKLAILNVLPFEEERLPVKYLGVPLLSSRLIFRDCKELIEKVQNRVNDWKNKFLSSAGRLQLIQSVLGSLHEVPYRGKMSWGWRKLLQLQPLIRDFIWSCIGDGLKTSMSLLLSRDGSVNPFSVHHVWDSIRPRDNLVPCNMIGACESSCSLMGSVVAAAAYFVWQERNSRLFKNTKRSVKEVVDCIMSSVRLKPLSCHFKKSKDAMLPVFGSSLCCTVMSSSPHSTITSSAFDMENAFSTMNIYTSASSRSTSFNSSDNSRDGMIRPTSSLFYNNPYLKDVQAFYAKESPIPPPDHITPPIILTPSPVLPPSLLFDPRYFFVPEELNTTRCNHSPIFFLNYVI